MTVQPDGKIVVAGPGRGGGVFIARYNVGGSLDVQFASSGLSSVTALGVEPMDDGSYDILVAGMTADGFSLVRYNPGGTRDTSFAVAASSSLFDGHSFQPCRVAVQSSGGIVLAGYVSLSGTTDLGMLRYNSDGSLDTTFGDAGGWLTAGLSVSTDDPCGLALGADDSIALAGTVIAGQDEFAVVRFDSSGNLQTGFGNGGVLLDNLGNSSLNDHATDIAVEPDGSLVVAGYCDGVSYPLELVRYLPDGSRDANFGDDGVVGGTSSTPLSGYALAVQADGKILVGGIGSSDTSFAVARFNVDGSLDTGFGSGGIVSQEFSGLDSRINSLAIEPDGRIVAAGVAGTEIGSVSASNEGVLARYMPGNVGSLSVRVDYASQPLTLSGDDSVAAGDTYYLSLGDGSTDFGAGSDIQYVVNWGDTTTATFTADQLNALGGQVTHVYAGYSGESSSATISVDLVDGANSLYPAGSKAITLDLSAATATTLTSYSYGSTTYGQAITFYAYVAVLGDTFWFPTGTVDFYDGTTWLGEASLNNYGWTYLPVSTLAVGDHGITAVYNPNETSTARRQHLERLWQSVTAASSPPVISAERPCPRSTRGEITN